MRLQTKLLFSTGLALGGAVLLFAPMAWYLWQETVQVEEQRVSALAESLAQRSEQLIVEAISVLDELNAMPAPPCSPAHVAAMHKAAIVQPHVKAIGYWRADERLCGAGYIQADAVKPPRADRIYESGVIAWWPSEYTTINGLPLFLIRFGSHDIAIDPQRLLDAGPLADRQAVLWVEGLLMASRPAGAMLPSPSQLATGLTVDQTSQQVLSRFSLGTVFAIDIVAAEPISRFWSRSWRNLIVPAAAGLLLILAWLVIVVRYSRRRFSLSGELREALSSDRIRVVYQPIIDLNSGDCVGAEALIRWRREDGELIHPDLLIPLAEEAGLMPALTQAVLRVILQQLGPLLRQRPRVTINLNVSGEDLAEDGFDRALRAQLEGADVSPRSIKLEITERALLNSDVVRGLIHDLRGRGHVVAIDDFGTGYSSLSYLESFDLDILKIDKSFVDAIEKDAVTSNVIGHVIDMAQSLDLQTVAEGIETEHQADWLRARGVTHGQGFLYARPLSARQFRRFLDTHQARVVHSLDEARSLRSG